MGFSDQKTKETVANKKVSLLLSTILSCVPDNADLAPFYYQLASTCTKNASTHIQFIASHIANGNLKSQEQVAAAIKYCDALNSAEPVLDVFKSTCGVGVIVSLSDIEIAVNSLLDAEKPTLDAKRYQLVGKLLGNLKKSLPWASSLPLKDELDKQLLARLGPKDERDDLKSLKKKEKALKAKIAKPEASKVLVGDRRVADVAKSSKFITEGELSRLHRAGENPQIRPDLMQEHLKRTNGRVITRFPPEPNGFLHIGHAKAININFGYAEFHKGITYLRYDDTNPEAELEEYFDAILDVVNWLGYKPFKVTYSSDHFQRLYELAIELIKKDKAYVCLCTGEEIHEHRGGDAKGPRMACVHRNRPIHESLEEFENMKNGKYDEGIATLRMKMDLENPNPQMWDLVAYRVLKTPHHRTGRTWCIYPTYDYTHCLCDSFEDITHSICTLEFVLSRESYYWLVDALGLYKPVQSEFGRLNLTGTITSKRKLNTLVTEGHVSGWDDPRLHTIAGIRRRGFTPEAVNAFVRDVGVTTATVTTPYQRLENYVRDHLNEISPRMFLVLDPIELVIEGVGNPIECDLDGKNSDGDRVQMFSRTIYIDKSDFREFEDPNFFRLAPGNTVGLLQVPFPVTCTGFTRGPDGSIIQVTAKYESSLQNKPKTYIQWLDVDRTVKVEARLYNQLFLHDNPQSVEEVPNGWISDLNPESLIVIKEAMAESGILNQPVGFTFQGVRVGYFCVDKDTTSDKVVLNRTVTLKEDSKKN